MTRRGNDENAVPAQVVARTKSAATSLGPPQKVAQPTAGAVKKAAPGGKVSGAKRTALGGVVNNTTNVKEELDEKPGR